MKKLLALILAAFMLLSITACNTVPSNTGSNGDNTQDTVKNNEEGNSNIPSNNNDPSNSDDTIKIGRILTGYHEGLMFVDDATNMEIRTISCIDKTGKTVFTIEASEIISGFHNGLAFVNQDAVQDKAVLCDKTGKIITAQELGGTSFNRYNPKIFEDGFILVSKTTTSYQGSVDEMAVFNSKLEKIVDFSEELYDYLIDNEFLYNSYYNGYLFEYDNYGSDSVLDLRTGTMSNDLAKWCENVELKNETDLWAVGEDGVVHFFSTPGNESYFIYDIRDLYSAQESWPVITPVIDLSETGGHIRSKNQLGTGFVDGYAALVFEVEDSEVGERHYFTIIDKTGSYCFEPVDVAGRIDEIKTENGIFVLSIVPRNRNESAYYIEVYDVSGKIGVKEYQEPDTSFWSIDFDISDETIYIQYDDYTTLDKDWIGIYNTNMQPLFNVDTITSAQ